ncbi:alpha-xylosidase [Amnibacterium sp.]|uniref:alpha-xylosidase n=1 Tax=Amnibacterium sp. TaxID=1872496 RepID=UPI003F7C7368
MRFTDGFWQTRPGVELLHAAEVRRVDVVDGSIHVLAPSAVVRHRGDTLNRPVVTLVLDSPADGIIRVRISHRRGDLEDRRFPLPELPSVGTVRSEDGATVLVSGDLEARVEHGAPFRIAFRRDGRDLTALGHKSVARATLAPDSRVGIGVTGTAGEQVVSLQSEVHTVVQLDLAVGESIYGLGERFGPFAKNGQTVEIWNADGGTSSEQAYKNVPFHLSSRGYGVLVNDAGHVSYEIGSEAVQRTQWSVPGSQVEFLIIDGPDPEEVLDRYTALTGRPAEVPAWSYGTWLSTSFTTDYDEATVNRFVDGMRERDLPLSVFHFDCFWMREFRWVDFEWDPEVFPDPVGMLERLHDRGLQVCVWINPYIAEASPLWDEAARLGHLVRRPDGSIWQWDLWQAGMSLVDFTSAAATAWFQEHLRRLVRQGVDAFKTDFGERIPVDVVWADGSSPLAMHNRYTQLYNEAVFSVLQEERGNGEAVVFARSATVGGQALPVHWGGDSTSTYASMAETLRGGLSLAMSGFAYWSHDIGGFEGSPDPGVFKRWTAFGMLSSHSRFHGSTGYRIPWEFDAIEGRDEADPQSAVSVTRRFATLKQSLLPYLRAAGRRANERGTPIMRPMALAYPDDPAVAHLDRQYLLGPDILVAPVFTADGDVDFYLPEGGWTSLLTGERVTGGGWRRERHGFDSLPVYVRDGAVLLRLPEGAAADSEQLVVEVYPGGGDRHVRALTVDGEVRFDVRRRADGVVVTADGPADWSARAVGGGAIAPEAGRADLVGVR